MKHPFLKRQATIECLATYKKRTPVVAAHDITTATTFGRRFESNFNNGV